MCTWLLRKRDLPKKFIRALTRAITLFSHNGRRRSGRRGSLAMRELPPIPRWVCRGVAGWYSWHACPARAVSLHA